MANHDKRDVSKAKGWAAVIVAGALFAACNTSNEQEEPVTGSFTASPTTTTAPAAITKTPAPTKVAPVGETVTVTDVVDGDTFKTSDGRTVRVLGIDSCEMDTYGGDLAKRDAENKLTNRYNQPIVLFKEPGVDTDRYGRQLRYVGINGGDFDFGVEMVKHDHTGVYQGKNDASDEYLRRLYAADLTYASNPPSGRECADPYPDVSSGGGHVDIDRYNNDDDGGDRESRFCRKRWWC